MLSKLLILGLLFVTVGLYAQPDKKFIRKGNRQYDKEKYQDSEILYRKATDKNNGSPDAIFNTGDALYRQQKFEDAGKQFIDNSNHAENASKKSTAFYNLGNSFLKSGKVKESIDAYKNSLKLDPANMMAKYNLGYAQNLLKQQQQQQQQKQNQDKKDQDKENDQEKKDQNQDKKDQNSQDQKKQEQQQQQQGISKEDAERLLNALANDEKNVQEKVKKEKAARARVRTEKNW